MTPIPVIVEVVRTRLPSGEETAVTVRGELRPGHPDSVGLGVDDLYLYLIDGPTGWESAPICRLLDDLGADPESPGWLACFGTPNSWDRLLVTRDSLITVGPGASLVPGPMTVELKPNPAAALATTSSGVDTNWPRGSFGRSSPVGADTAAGNARGRNAEPNAS